MEMAEERINDLQIGVKKLPECNVKRWKIGEWLREKGPFPSIVNTIGSCSNFLKPT